MRRLAWLALIAGIACAQEAHKEPTHNAPAAEHSSEAGKSDHGSAPSDLWKWANFAILAGGLGYLIGKNAGSFFDSRTQQIKKDMIESAAARKDAEARAAEVERRLANLEGEIAALRTDAQKEAAAETERLAQQGAAEIAKIQAHAEQEIVSAGKTARLELKRYSAQLAVELAEQKIRTRITPDTQDELVQSFVRNLK